MFSRLFKGLFARLPSTAPAADGIDRRVFDRRPVTLPVMLRVGEAQLPCNIADVSATGAFLTPHHGLEIGAKGTIMLPDMPVTADVSVVRRTDSGLGVAFDSDAAGAVVAGWARGRSAPEDASED